MKAQRSPWFAQSCRAEQRAHRAEKHWKSGGFPKPPLLSSRCRWRKLHGVMLVQVPRMTERGWVCGLQFVFVQFSKGSHLPVVCSSSLTSLLLSLLPSFPKPSTVLPALLLLLHLPMLPLCLLGVSHQPAPPGDLCTLPDRLVADVPVCFAQTGKGKGECLGNPSS